MENIEAKKVIDTEVIEAENKSIESEHLFTKIMVNELTQNRELAKVLHKILTLCSLSKTVAPKVLTWANFVETITKHEFEELSKIEKNFNFQITNRDFKNDDNLKREFAIQEQKKMTDKLSSLIDTPRIDKVLLDSQINLTETELQLLTPFFFPNDAEEPKSA